MIVLLSGCTRQAQPVKPEPKSPEEAAFLAADARLAAAKGEAFFGNTPEAKERAEAFAGMFKTSLLFASAAARTEKAAFERDVKLPTHCEMRAGRVAFMVHVRDLEHASEKAKGNLVEVAFLAAKVAMIGLDTETTQVAIGFRGTSGYSLVATGIAEYEEKHDQAGTEALYAFFSGEPLKGPATMAEFMAARAAKRGQGNPAAPPMLAGEPRAKHPSVGVVGKEWGRVGLAVAVAPRMWVTAQNVLPAGVETIEVVDAENRERVIRLVGRRGCEIYLRELGEQHAPPTFAVNAPVGDRVFLYGVTPDLQPVATAVEATALATDARGPLMTDAQLSLNDLGRPLFDAEDRFVGLACNVEPRDPLQLMAVGDVRDYLKSIGIDERGQRKAAQAGY